MPQKIIIITACSKGWATVGFSLPKNGSRGRSSVCHRLIDWRGKDKNRMQGKFAGQVWLPRALPQTPPKKPLRPTRPSAAALGVFALFTTKNTFYHPTWQAKRPAWFASYPRQIKLAPIQAGVIISPRVLGILKKRVSKNTAHRPPLEAQKV